MEGGQRAVMFNRVGGTQQVVYGEGLHFRVPWFQYPVIYDIRYVNKCNVSHLRINYIFILVSIQIK